MILDKALEPASPRNPISREDNENAKPAIIMLAIIDIVVGMMPYCDTITSEVVKTAGPTINGVPRGTAPSSLLGMRLSLTGLIHNRALQSHRNSKISYESTTICKSFAAYPIIELSSTRYFSAIFQY